MGSICALISVRTELATV